MLRHAEQTPVGAMMDGDPPLNETGQQRAAALSVALKEAGITAVVTSQYARSRQTAEPLARALGLEPQTLAKDDLPALIAGLRERHAQDTVLVVAHSDTIPALLKLWGHPAAVEVGKAEFGSLWLVVPRDGKPPLVSRIRL
ncbi:MAG TPA: phosphoglycerate mutase family protein [Microvirga sp.]|nr:phosphoglycerate mutase family protein [Microvirga sp.]